MVPAIILLSSVNNLCLPISISCHIYCVLQYCTFTFELFTCTLIVDGYIEPVLTDPLLLEFLHPYIDNRHA